MSELDTIRSALACAARRRRWHRAWLGLWNGLLVGGSVWLITLLIYKLAPISVTILYGAGGVAVLALLCGFLYGWMQRRSLEQTARWVDGSEHLQERLSTALELGGKSGPAEEWRKLLIADAARFAAQVDPRKLLPIRLPKVSRWVLIVLTLSAGLGFIPEYRTKEFLAKKQEAEVIKAAGQKIVELTRQNLEHHTPALEPTRKALESTEQLGIQLAHNSITRAEALKDLASVSDKLKSELKSLQNPSLKSLDRAARESSKGSGFGVDAETQKKIDDLQKSLGKTATPEGMDKLKSELDKIKQAASGMPTGDSQAAKEARKQMAQALSNLSKHAEEMGQKMPNIDQAIAALEANQTDNFVKDLDAATTDLEKLRDMANTLQQLQQQGKEGKDLPEQLKYGQAEAAQQRLEKMVEQLKSGKATPEQMQQMLDEVSRSVDPATPYGKAAEALKNAVAKMQKNQKAEAADSLADAAKELQKAMDQMQDAQSLMASLEAVNKAEKAIATRLNWGQCPFCGGKAGECEHAGIGRGGKPGRGVGTWADENNLYPEMTEHWDNSGADRADTAPRGLTDRGDGQLADNLAPTKLKGKMSPGGNMPSITLKGVNIKGQSSVQYQEAVTAAQSAAQSALNQDQVPRAYQNTVRDYFDDLKK